MEESPEPNDPTPTAPAPTGTAQPDQAALDAMAGRIRSEERRKARAELEDLLGGQKPEEVAELLKRAAEAEQAQMSEAEKALAAANAAKAEADADRAQLRRDRVDVKLRQALLTPGGDDAPAVNPSFMEQAVLLAMGTALEDGDDSVARAVAELRQTVPVFFVVDGGKPAPVTTPGAAGGPKHGEGKGAPRKTYDEIAADLAQKWLAKQRRSGPAAQQ